MRLQQLTTEEDASQPEYASPECQKLFEIYKDYYPKVGYNPPWVAYLVRDEQQILGSCGFVQKPQDGMVEIAYWTFPKYQGRGVASFACKELLKISEQNDPSILVVAKTAPEENASTQILKKNGFQYSHVVQDDEIGDAWFWVCRKNRA